MIGILLQAVATFSEEISGSLGKWMVERKEESFYALGFQSTTLATLFFVVFVALDPSRWHFDPRSLPTLTLLGLIVLVQGWAALKAAATAERSTFNFVRTGTIPLLLAVDLFLGYKISMWQILGITLITIALIILFVNHGIEKKGIGIIALTAVGSVATISLYKWHITVFNSVATEQLILHAILSIYYFWGAWRFFRENPLRLMGRPHAIAQSMTYGAGVVLDSFSYLFGPASVILTAKRSFAVLWSIIAGNKIFHEKALGLRLVTLSIIITGLFLLVL